MAHPEHVEPPQRLAQAVAAERQRLESELAQTENQAHGVRRRLRAIEERAADLREQLRELNALRVGGAAASDKAIQPRLLGEPAERTGPAR